MDNLANEIITALLLEGRYRLYDLDGYCFFDVEPGDYISNCKFEFIMRNRKGVIEEKRFNNLAEVKAYFS